MVERLPDDEVAAGLERLPGWTRDGDVIRRSFTFPGFPDAVTFVVRVGFLAERADHHPDLDVRWRRVDVSLSTHEAKGLTTRDLALAAEIDGVARAAE